MRYISFSPETLQQARMALEDAGFRVEADVMLLEMGVLLAAWNGATGAGYLLGREEVTLIAHYGPEYARGGLVGLTAGRVPRDDRFYADRRYVESAVARIIASFRAEAAPGNRNNALNRAAYQLGRLVGGDLMPEEEAQRILESEARAVGLLPHEIKTTAKSGLGAGKRKPAAGGKSLGIKRRTGIIP